MDFLNAAWSLLSELIAGEIENLESFIFVFLIDVFQFFILRREPTTSSSVDDKKDFSAVFVQGNFLSLIINRGVLQLTMWSEPAEE